MRYRLRTLLIAVTFASVCFGGIIWRVRFHQENSNWYFRMVLIMSVSPYWVPVVFGAYAMGRRQMSFPFICAFVAAEAAAVASVVCLERVLHA